MDEIKLLILKIYPYFHLDWFTDGKFFSGFFSMLYSCNESGIATNW